MRREGKIAWCGGGWFAYRYREVRVEDRSENLDIDGR